MVPDAGDAVENPEVGRVLEGDAGLADWRADLYRDLHRHPELAHQEHRTAQIASASLREAGFEVHEAIGSTGLVGVLRNGGGPTVLVRADMDGLPVREQTGLDYASTQIAADTAGLEVPVAHACGHDVHVACLLAAARLLAGQRDAWLGTFVALFQPAEEAGNGAASMVDAGLADLIPKPDVALAQHVVPLPAGLVGIRPGPFFSAADSIRVTVHGRGGHGSAPHLTIDPVVLASAIVMRLQAIVAREVAPDDVAVVTVGRIAAGTKGNIIADHAVLDINIRTYRQETRERVLGSIERIVRAECQGSGSPREPDFEYGDHYPVTDNDPATVQRLDAAFRAHFGQAAFTIDPLPASEDFSVIPDALGVPYAYWAIGGADPAAYAAAEAAGEVAERIPTNHSPQYAPVIDPTLETGTAAIVVASLEWLAGSPRAV